MEKLNRLGLHRLVKAVIELRMDTAVHFQKTKQLQSQQLTDKLVR